MAFSMTEGAAVQLLLGDAPRGFCGRIRAIHVNGHASGLSAVELETAAWS